MLPDTKSQNRPSKIARVNLAILTFNALDYTKMCIESISKNTRVPHNIFILDNGSTDGTRAWLRQQNQENLYWEDAPSNLGVPGGRNYLINIIQPFLPDDGYIVFSDNDMELKEGWDTQYLSFFEDHPEAGIASAFGHRMIVRKYHRELLPAPAYTAPVDVACGGFACWIRAKALKAVGGFDENLGLFWHEDDDFSLRTIGAGWDVYALPHVNVVHHEHKSGAANPGIKSGGSPKNQIYLCEKWRKLGLVDSQGRIIRRFSQDVVKPAKSLNMGGFHWLRPEATLIAPQSNGAMLSFSMACARKEYYDTFPFSTEVLTPAGSMRFTFSQSDETHEICIQADAGSKITIKSSASFSPAMSGLGAHCQGALGVRLNGWPGPLMLASDNKPTATADSVAWFSSAFDTDRYSELARAIVPALKKQNPTLSFHCLGSNEQIVSEIQSEPLWVGQWQEIFKKNSPAKNCIVAADPLTSEGTCLYQWVRENNPQLQRLIGFVLLEEGAVSQEWIEAAMIADEIWLLTEKEKKILIDAGADAHKLWVIPIGVSEEFVTRSRDVSSAALLDGRICFYAQVDSAHDPFLRTCVQAITSAFSVEDGVALLVSISPTGVQLPPDFIKAVSGNPNLEPEKRAPVFTVSPYAQPGTKRKIFDVVHCLLTSAPTQRRLEVLEALSSGLPCVYLDPSTEQSKVLSLAEDKETLLTLGMNPVGSEVALGNTAVQGLIAQLQRVRSEHAALKNEAAQRAWNMRTAVADSEMIRWIDARLANPSAQAVVAKPTMSETIIREVVTPLVVGIDARTLTYAETRERGIGHYTINHLAEIFRQRPEWNFILYRNAGETSDALDKLLEHRNVRLGNMGEQHHDNLDLYHIADPMTILPGFDSPFLTAPAVPTSAVFFDLIPLVKRDMHFDCWKDWTKTAYMRRLNELKASDVVALSISECSRVDLHRLTEFPLERAVTIMAGINRSNLGGTPSSEALQRIKEKFGLHLPFFMSVGGLDGHKGFVATAQAYATLRSS
ncbi:MAG: glycosyltransferase, partial [Deltaproteobacteria bacterium]|nr:glycosyltransferase [Deltaproteobacteria bacterium]